MLLLLALLATLVIHHVAAFLDGAVLLHGINQLEALEQINSGELWARGPMLGDSGFFPSGPLNYWLYTPWRVVTNPALGAHLMYFVLEALSLLAWVLLARRAAFREEVAWIGALLLGCWWLPKITLMENATLSGFVITAAFGVLSAALARRRVGWMSLAGLLLGVAVLLHMVAAMAVPAAMAAVVAAGGPRKRRLLELCLGGLLPVALCWPGIDLSVLPDGLFKVPEGQSAIAAPEQHELLRYALAWLPRQLPALAGAAVAVAGVFSGGRRAGALLLLLWLAVAVPPTVIAATDVYGVFGMVSVEDRVNRILAVLAPVLTCLEAVAIWAAFRWGAALLERRRGTRVSSAWLLGAVAAAALVWSGARLAAATARPVKPPAERYLHYLQNQERESRAAYWYFDKLTDAGLLDTGILPEQLCAAGWSARLLLHWPLKAEPMAGAVGEDVAVFPRLEEVKLEALPGAKQAGPLVLLSGLHRVHTWREDTAHLFQWPLNLSTSGLLLMLIEGNSKQHVPTVQMAGAHTVAMMHARTDDGFVQWRVLKVGAKHPAPGKPVKVRVTPLGAQVDSVCLVHR